jgi:hypothetical protein
VTAVCRCGGRLSTPIVGRRTGLVISTCVACGASVHRAAPPPPVPSRPRAPRGAFARFEQAYRSGAVRTVIWRAHRESTRANASDPRLRQIGADE